MTKSRAQLLKSYRSMPAESRRVQNLDPRKMLKGFLVTKLSAYRCEVRKLENEVKELNFHQRSQDCNDQESDMIKQKEVRLARITKYLHALEARKGGALNDDPIFAEWGIDASILSTLAFDGDNIPAATGHYTVPTNGEKKQTIVKKVQKVKVSSGIDMYRSQKLIAHSFPKKQVDDVRKVSSLRRSARLKGVEPDPILPISLKKDEVFMNKDAEQVKASNPTQPVSRSFNLVDVNPRLVPCCITEEEITPEIWDWWLEKSGNQDPELHVFHPKVVRFAKGIFKTDDLTRAMLIDSSLRLHYLKPETPFYQIFEPILSPEEMFPLIQNPTRSIEFFPGMEPIRLYECDVEDPEMTAMFDCSANMTKELNILRCVSYERERASEKFFDPDIFMNDICL